MKKIISAILLISALISIFCTQTVNAQTEDSIPYVQVVGNDYIEKGVVRLYVTNQEASDNISVRFETGNESTKKFFDFDTLYEDFDVNPTAIYSIWSFVSDSTGSGGGKCNNSFIYDKSGEYKRVKIKLSDYSNFNEDGTYNQTLADISHDYTFKNEEGGFQSSIVFFSGNAITVTAPDSQGYVEIYCSTDIRHTTLFMTNFRYRNGGVSASGGGTSGTAVKGVRKGNADMPSGLDVRDATLIQKSVAQKVELNSVQEYCADANNDGNIAVTDATLVQKYLAMIYR